MTEVNVLQGIIPICAHCKKIRNDDGIYEAAEDYIAKNTELTLSKLPADSEAKEFLDQTLTSSKQAADLCQQLLAYSGRGRFVIEPIDLPETVNEMLNLLQVTLSKGINLSCDFEKNVPPVEADATQIKQAIMNLVINAADAIGAELEGVIEIAVGTQTIGANDLPRVVGNQEFAEGRYVFLEVKDSGCGMDTDTLNSMFDPFFSTKELGHGLGLSAMLGIVRGHNGAITVDSTLGKGTVVRILLPAAIVAPSKLADSDDVDTPYTGGTILVVDDEAFVRTFAESALKSRGYDTITATNGKEAVEIYELNDIKSMPC